MIDIHATDNSREIAEQTAGVLRREGKKAAVVETVLLNWIAETFGGDQLTTSDRFVIIVEAAS